MSDTPVYRIAKGDLVGCGVVSSNTIRTSDIMSPDGIKVGDIIEDFWSSGSTSDKEIWKVTAVNGTSVSVQNLGKRTFPSYNDTDVKRRITALEARPDFNSLTETQRNSLRGPAGARGANGATGPAGPRGADGAPGQNIINQNGGQALKYWAGTRSKYDAISNKDANTIYDIYR